MSVPERNVPVHPPQVPGPWDGELTCVHCGGRNHGRFSVRHEASCPTIPSRTERLTNRIAASLAHEKAEKTREREKRQQSERLRKERENWQ